MQRSSLQVHLYAFFILATVAIIYLPVRDGGFFWVEKIWLRDLAWFRSGSDWTQFIFHTFGEWNDYFRPLVTLLLVAEDRGFDVSPGPMHLVSLAIHLANTALVGALAWHLSTDRSVSNRKSLLVAGAMLFYGLHPAMTEPVAWIACQFELVAALFLLIGLLINITVKKMAQRSTLVAACFFFSACSKESAICFLPLIILVDWMRGYYRSDFRDIRNLLKSNWPVYIAILFAGGLYLILRWYSLGFLVEAHSERSFLSAQRFQLSAYSFLTYWQVIFWPMVGQGPVHYFLRDASVIDIRSLVVDIGAVSIIFGSALLAWRRHVIGYIGVAVFFGLFPVLNIIPVAFDPSYYHDRYAGIAIAMVCSLTPSLPLDAIRSRAIQFAVYVACALWLAVAVANIRVTLPLWGDELMTWQWVLRENPNSTVAKDHLLSTYMERGLNKEAQPIADDLIAHESSCANCMLNVANLALMENDVVRASTALEKLKNSTGVLGAPRIVQGYVLASAQLYELEDNFNDAEGAFKSAMSLDPLDPQAKMGFALFLARRGRLDEARANGESAISLFAPDERSRRREVFDQTLTNSAIPAHP